MSGRIEAMEAFVQQQPDNPFPRYALALEYKNAGRPDEAVATFRELAQRLPAYVPTYLQLGMLLHALDRPAEAREVLRAGLERAREAKDGHAAGELEGLLAELA